jgi:PAS domain S-box-containing protein
MQKKALVVDSDFFFVEFLSGLLSKRGYRVLKAYNGKEGIAKLEYETVDILFADLVLPKVDGWQFFKLIRNKYNGNHFPMVALSGTMIEQLGSLQEIGADYLIAKGPIDQLTLKLNDFMAEFETQPFLPPVDKKVLTTENVFPRRDAVELLNSMQFHQAVINCAAVGILIVDSDTRIIGVNPAALEIMGRTSVEIINYPLAELFGQGQQAALVNGLRVVSRQGKTEQVSLKVNICSQAVRALISPLEFKSKFAGWVIALESGFQGEN